MKTSLMSKNKKVDRKKSIEGDNPVKSLILKTQPGEKRVSIFDMGKIQVNSPK